MCGDLRARRLWIRDKRHTGISGEIIANQNRPSHIKEFYKVLVSSVESWFVSSLLND